VTHWQTWHEAYADPDSGLTRRLRLVQAQIDAWLDLCADRPVRVLSLCAGEGRDLLEVLAARADADRVTATLVELDAGLAQRAREAAARWPSVEVRTGDAGDPGVYAGLPPADLVLLCGVLGNMSDDDVQHVLSVLPALLASGGRVIWTRTRRPPDLTPAVRAWLADSGFHEVAFQPVPDSLAAVGVADLALPAGGDLGRRRLFTFLDRAEATNRMTLEAYEARADAYADGESRPPEWHRAFLREVAGRLRPGARVLELGSGTGGDAAYLTTLGVGVQTSDATAAFVRRLRAAGVDARRIDVLTDDLGGPWDAVLAMAMLLHLTPDELDAALRRIRAAVPPGGLLAATVKEGDGFGWSSHKLGLPRYFTYWRADPLRALLAQAGWRVERLDHQQGDRDAWLQVIATRREEPPDIVER
jgi:SAM-dependent methyltransferase